ncbi:MAG: cyclophilin-like family protein [Candidatus Helarchaeota archaeon]
MKMIIWTDIGRIGIQLFPESAPTSISILKKAPSRAVPVHFFGKELFFGLPGSVYEEAYKRIDELEKDELKKDFEIGEVAFWKGRSDIPLTDPLNPGACICIFYGNTLGSRSPEALEPINLIGRVTENFELLEKLTVENIIKIEKIE